MSSISSAIDLQLSHPEEWRIAIRVETGRITFAACCDAERDSLLCRSVDITPSDPNRAEADLENCVYDNPFFLQEFKQTRVIVPSTRFMIMPDDVAASREAAQAAFATLYGAPAGDLLIDPMPRCRTALVHELPPGLLPFLNRTFYNPPVRHPLSAICEHFAGVARGAGVSRLCAYLHDRTADIALIKAGKLAFANSLPCASPDDAAFFILSVWNKHQLDQTRDEVQITGDKLAREAVTARLRQYIAYVMPALYPLSAMKIAKDAINAPFDLIITLLCE